MKHVLPRHLLCIVLSELGGLTLHKIVIESRVRRHKLFGVPSNLLRGRLWLFIPKAKNDQSGSACDLPTWTAW